MRPNSSSMFGQSGNSSASAGPSATWPPSPGTGTQSPPPRISAPTPRPVPGPSTTLAPAPRRCSAPISYEILRLQRRERQRQRLEIVEEHDVLHAEPSDHVGRADHPVGVGEVDGVAVDRPGEVDERGARPELGVGEHGRFDRRLDVGKIGGRDRLEQDQRRFGVGDQREARIGAADIADEHREGQAVGRC